MTEATTATATGGTTGTTDTSAGTSPETGRDGERVVQEGKVVAIAGPVADVGFCDSCGWLGREGEECPVCGHATRQTPDVIDEMAAAVIDAGGRVEHVYADTPLSGPVVAALLRFPVPQPGPATASGGEGGG